MSPNTLLKIVAFGLMSLSSSLALGPAPVNLGLAANFVILAQSGVSTVPQSAITGNVGVSPASAASLTGFAITKLGTSAFSTQVVGSLMAADFSSPTPAILLASVKAVGTAFTDASTRPSPAGNLNLGAGSIGGLTFAPGVYKWSSAVNIPTAITIKGSPVDTWIFQVGSSLTLANGIAMTLVGGALPQNIVWVVTGKTTLGSTSTFQGILLGGSAASLATGATVNGRLLVGTAVTLEKSTVNAPTAGFSPSSPSKCLLGILCL